MKKLLKEKQDAEALIKLLDNPRDLSIKDIAKLPYIYFKTASELFKIYKDNSHQVDSFVKKLFL